MRASPSARLQGVKAGALGDVGAFSFFPSKNLGGFGDGGMVTTDDDAFAASLRALLMHGETSRYHHRFVGGNFRLDALQAAVLHVKLPHLDGWAEGRRRTRGRSSRVPRGRRPPPSRRGPGVPREAAGRHHVFNQFVVRVGKGRRDALKDSPRRGRSATPSTTRCRSISRSVSLTWDGRQGDFPEAESGPRETLAIPVFPELTDGQKSVSRLLARRVLAEL